MEKKPIFDMKAFQKWNIKVPLIQGGMGVGTGRKADSGNHFALRLCGGCGRTPSNA